MGKVYFAIDCISEGWSLEACPSTEAALKKGMSGESFGSNWKVLKEVEFEIKEIPAPKPTITDGYSTWPATCPTCGGKMQVVRPGKVQCEGCELTCNRWLSSHE